MANNPYKIKFFIGTPAEVESQFNSWILEGGFIYSNMNMAGTADKIVLSVVYRMEGSYMYF